MQKYYGLDADGKWGPNSQSVTGMSADEAWAAMSSDAKTGKKETEKKPIDVSNITFMSRDEFNRRISSSPSYTMSSGAKVTSYKEYVETRIRELYDSKAITAAEADALEEYYL